MTLSKYKEALDAEILNLPLLKKPENLYDPISYILGIGGKKIRPLLCLMSCDLYSGDFQKAMPQALAVEIFHNFTLLHDDIMDKAEKRRNKPTVHVKWNEPVAILSGDLMLILAYEEVMKAPHHLQHQFFTLFSQTARQICEGQQFDMDFEQIPQPPLTEYIEMIRLKTAVLLGCSLKLGALIGGSNEIDADNLYEFGINTGIAFQIIDDLLDSFGDENTFGKRIGGDILANKKTFLRITAMENETAKAEIEAWDYTVNETEKIAAIKGIYLKQKVIDTAQKAINHYHQNAIGNIENLNLNDASKKVLLDFAEGLLQRSV